MPIQFKTLRTIAFLCILGLVLLYAYVKRTTETMLDHPALQAQDLSISQIVKDNHLSDYFDNTSGLIPEYMDTCDEARFQSLLPSILSIKQDQFNSWNNQKYVDTHGEFLSLPYRDIRTRARSVKAILNCQHNSHPQIIMPAIRIMAQDFLLLVRYSTMMVDYAGAGALAKDLLESIEKYQLMAAPDMEHRQEVYQIVKLVLESLPEAETIIQQEIKGITQLLQNLERLYPLIMSMYAIRHGWASTAYNNFMQSEFSFDKLLTIHPIAQLCVTNVPQFRLNHENLIHRVQTMLLINP